MIPTLPHRNLKQVLPRQSHPHQGRRVSLATHTTAGTIEAEHNRLAGLHDLLDVHASHNLRPRHPAIGRVGDLVQVVLPRILRVRRRVPNLLNDAIQVNPTAGILRRIAVGVHQAITQRRPVRHVRIRRCLPMVIQQASLAGSALLQ